MRHRPLLGLVGRGDCPMVLVVCPRPGFGLQAHTRTYHTAGTARGISCESLVHSILESSVATLNNREFLRLRIGIGRRKDQTFPTYLYYMWI